MPRGVPRQGSTWGPILHTKTNPAGSSGCAFSYFNALLIKSQAIFSGFSKQLSVASYANFMYIYLNKLGHPYQLKKKRSTSIVSPPSRLLPKRGSGAKTTQTPRHVREALPLPPPTPAKQKQGAYHTPNFQPPHRTLTSLSPSVCISKPSLAFPRSCLVLFHRSHYCLAQCHFAEPLPSSPRRRDRQRPFLLGPIPTELEHLQIQKGKGRSSPPKTPLQPQNPVGPSFSSGVKHRTAQLL